MNLELHPDHGYTYQHIPEIDTYLVFHCDVGAYQVVTSDGIQLETLDVNEVDDFITECNDGIDIEISHMNKGNYLYRMAKELFGDDTELFSALGIKAEI